jgi:phage terminase Nu1 subunit (DNA packaging protein)
MAGGGAPKGARAKPLAEATKARGRLTNVQAKLAEAKLRQLSGELVEAAAVEREWTGICRMLSAGMLAVTSRVAQRLPHLTKRDLVEIDAEIRAGLTELGAGKKPA